MHREEFCFDDWTWGQKYSLKLFLVYHNPIQNGLMIKQNKCPSFQTIYFYVHLGLCVVLVFILFFSIYLFVSRNEALHAKENQYVKNNDIIGLCTCSYVLKPWIKIKSSVCNSTDLVVSYKYDSNVRSSYPQKIKEWLKKSHAYVTDSWQN